MEELIRLDHIYTSDENGHQLRDFNMTVFSGEFLFLIGPYGSGKHLVSRLLTGDLLHDSGTVTVLNHSPLSDSFLRNVHYLSDTADLIDSMTIYENIFLLRKPHGKRKWLFPKKAAVLESQRLLSEMGIMQSPYAKVKNLSHFERLLLCLIRIFSASPQLLILSQKEFNLSGEESEKIKEILLRKKADGISCLFISNYVTPLVSIADTALIMEHGRDRRTFRHQVISPELINSYLSVPVSHNISISGHSSSDPGKIQLELRSGARTLSVWTPGKITGFIDSSPDALLCFESYLESFCRINKIDFILALPENAASLSLADMKFVPENIENHLLNNLGIADNMLLPRYPRLCGWSGVIPASIAEYCTKEFLSYIHREDPLLTLEDLTQLERRILGIYRFCTKDVHAIFIDFPFIGMDQKGCDFMKYILTDISKKGIAIFISSKHYSVLEKYCSDILVCNDCLITDIVPRP